MKMNWLSFWRRKQESFNSADESPASNAEEQYLEDAAIGLLIAKIFCGSSFWLWRRLACYVATVSKYGKEKRAFRRANRGFLKGLSGRKYWRAMWVYFLYRLLEKRDNAIKVFSIIALIIFVEIRQFL